ncbi:hypothetical protein RND81_14G067100 [Saponaria officinalis]|uniref:Uncharacterized protein n=1 Tax=Saponaria officinalis TaxID=3572 RepID=A0AAW1GIJ0_SAPOF
MEKGSSSDSLHTLMEAIKSSELVENRIQLITKLGDAVLPTDSDLCILLEFLAVLWEGFTCLDVSQCMLNKAILDVAGKFLVGNPTCQEKFLILGTQACEWCAKHLKMTLMSSGESQEEDHYMLFFQLLSECFIFSASCLSLIANNHILDDALMTSLDTFSCELLSLVKDLATDLKKIQSLTSELLKEAEVVLESAIKVCKVYAQEVNLGSYSQITQNDGSSLDDRGASHLNHVTNLIKHMIEKLSELGILAADSGGSLVTVLNLSWKGVISLLQLGGNALSQKVNIGEIISILISLAIDSLRCAADTWYSSGDQTISTTEAKRAFIPIKFYLVNAVKICSQYPLQAFAVYREVTRCILLLTTLTCTFSAETYLKNVCEALEELLKPTSLQLLKSFLNSSQLSDSQKLQILDWLFSIERHLLWDNMNQITDFQNCSLDELFSVDCEAMPTVRTSLLGRVVLFADVLKTSFDLHEFVLLEIAKKLQRFLDVFVDDEVYTFALVLRIPASHSEGKSLELTWEPFLFCFLNALKIFMIIISGTPAWYEMECFLHNNLFHPHTLCWEIIVELWCFTVRHAESSTVDMVVDKLCSLYKLVSLSDSPFSPHSRLRKMARSMCLLLASCTASTVDRVYRSILIDERSDLSAIMYAGLMMEGFQVNLLSDNMKAGATERIFQDYARFVDDYIENPIYSCSTIVHGLPVAALCSSLHSMQIDASGLDNKTIRLLLAAIQNYKNSTDAVIKSHSCRLVCEALEIISSAKHLYGYDQMEHVIIELQKLFITGPSSSGFELQECKPALASFMSSLAHMEMIEGDESAKTSAIWQLYHMLLRERHWALIHLAISAFGYFAAHTSCGELWRFLPPNAALSFDLESGKNANVEWFMSELKVFLDKEMALSPMSASSPEQFELVVKDGCILRELYQKNSYLGVESVEHERMENDDANNNSNKRRKLPNGFSHGMELLHSGLKIIGDGLSQCKERQEDLTEVDDKIYTHFSRLEDVVKHLTRFADIE